VLAKGANSGAQTAAPPQTQAVPVAVAKAARANVPVYYIGLGSVIPYFTVTIHTRVDGQLMSVHYKEGEYVRAGDLLAQIDPRPFQVQLEQAEAQYQHDLAALKNARFDLQRYSALVKNGAVPSQQYQTQIATVDEDEAQLKLDQASIDNAKLQLIYCRITAPVNGRIGLRLVDPGNIVHASDTTGLMVITQMQPVTVIFSLPQNELLPVAASQRSGRVLRVDALSRDLGRVLASGRLLAVDNQMNQSTGTGNLRAVFENLDSALFPNEFVNARVLLNVLRRQVVVPSVAVQHSPQGAFVWAVAGNAAAVRPVTVGIVEGARTSIAGGLKAGETVVVDGFENLQPGSRVAVRPGLAAVEAVE
jgi:membrane fusion protein, multidrug efflux system